MKKITLSFLLSILFITFLSTAKAQTYCPPNIDFENGGFTNWICNVGTVTQGTTGNPAVLTYPINPTGPSVTQHVLKSSGVDIFGQFPTVCNYINGNHFSVKLGDDQVGAVCASMKYKVNIPVNNNHFSLTFYYALVFENPMHQYEAQPGFSVIVIDSTTNLPINLCSNFSVVQPVKGGLNGFSMIPHLQQSDTIYFKDWTGSTLDFSGLAGKTIYLQFDAFDCAYGGHFGYAYVDLPMNRNGNSFFQSSTCSPSNLPLLIAPSGYSSYQWYDSSFSNLISSNDTLSISTSPTIDTTLHYCVLTSFNNWGCKDTFEIKYNLTPVVAANFFYPTSYCSNSTMQFIDNSYSNNTGPNINNWEWNFGDVNATSNNPNTDSTQNPTHSYSAMGAYTVCLIAKANLNCIVDTICKTININRLAPTINLNFTKDSVCGFSDTITIYTQQNAFPGFRYHWILDKNTHLVSGDLDSISPIVVLFDSIGYHTIQLNGIPNPLDTNCATASSTQIYVKGLLPEFGITAFDSVCSSAPISLTINALPSYSGPTSTSCALLTQVNLGTNSGSNVTIPTVFNGFYTESKVQMLYTKAELNAAGFYGGIISKLTWNVLAKNSTQPYQGFSIKMAAVNYSLLSNSIDSSTNLTLVYTSSAYSTTLGINQFNFNNNFAWNGNSNLLLEVCFDNGTSNWTFDDIVAKSTMPSAGYCNWTRSDSHPLNACDKYYPYGNVITTTYVSTERPDVSLFYCNVGTLSATSTYSWSSNPAGISGNSNTINDTLYSTKIYTVSVTDNGCTNTQNHTIKTAQNFYSTIIKSICGGMVFNFNGKSYSKTGIFYDTMHTALGCDSIYMLQLQFLYSLQNQQAQVCQGSSYIFLGNIITQPGNYQDTIHHPNSCDTIINLQLTVIDSVNQINASICSTSTKYFFNGQYLYIPGIYSDTIYTNVCATILRLTLSNDSINDSIYIMGNKIYAFDTRSSNFYQWYDNINNQLPNGNNSSYQPLSVGYYKVLIQNSHCAVWSNFIYFDSLLNGIENNINNDNQFSIYPNPCGEKLLVISDKLLVNTIEVTDVLGRVMLKNEASNQLINKSSNQQIQLDVSTLSNGIYFIKVMDINGNEMNRKFVKE